jgi:hypothetical protein
MHGQFVINKARESFLVLVVLPALLGFLIYAIRFRTNYRVHPSPGVIASWSTWHAYEHAWCYILAVVVWFAAIWFHLRSRPEG